MRVNIIEQVMNDKYLLKVAEEFAVREALQPYLIMSEKTMLALEDARNGSVVSDKYGYEFMDYKILINNNLSFGDVDIR